jgi:hypothetical protein
MRLSSFIGLTLCLLTATAQADMTIDLSQTQGFGTGAESMMIKNIRVDIPIVNPFDPSRPTIHSTNYDVPFRFDRPSLHLIPDLSGAATDTSPNRSCANLTVLVNNAVNGSVLSGATVMVDNARSANTDGQGNAVFSGLPAGVVAINAALSDYNPSTRSETLVCGENRVAFSLSPSRVEDGGLAANEVRVILNWGEEPFDLDAHLTGPQPGLPVSDINESERFHIYWWEQSSSDGVATLDVDDVTSFGPETVTISPPTGASVLRPGVYRYSVYHYDGTGTLADNARVTLMIGSNSRTFTPPAGQLSGPDDVWTVFELNVASNGQMTVLPVNTYSRGNGSSQVRHGGRTATGYGAAETGYLFWQTK